MNPDTGSKVMNKNIMIVLGGAVLAAVLVAVLVQVTLGGKKHVSDNPDSVVQVLVAARDLHSPAEVKDGDFTWKEWPKDTVFKSAIIREGDQDADKVLDGRYARDIAAGEPIRHSMMLKAKKGNFVAASLAEGERAVSIKVKAENMVAGFIGPGTYVDVILTYTHKIQVSNNSNPLYKMVVEENLDQVASETILQNVRVLAIDQTTERDFDEKVKTGKTVTLAVPIADAEKIALADKMGTITLALRGVGDSKIDTEPRPTITDERLTHIRNEILAEYVKLRGNAGASSSGQSSIKVFNGTQVQTYSEN